MTFPETLNTKVADKELSFPLVTHMVYSDARFGINGILKSGRGVENFLDRLQTGERSGFKSRRCTKLDESYLQTPLAIDAAFQCLLTSTFSVTTAVVTAVLTQPHAEFSGSP
jgi:hypothetical protein